jgi:hypothetical protein
MAAGSTYSTIATTTLASATASYTFSSIPSTYTDLVLIASGTLDSGAVQDLRFQVNGDTSTNYSATLLYGTGTAAGSTRFSNDTYGILDFQGSFSTTQRNIYIVNFMNYANTTTYKTVIGRSNRADSGTDAWVNLWRSTAAINSILLTCPSRNMASGTTFTLYGIAAA